LGGWIFFQNIVKLLIRINAPTFLAHIEHQSLFGAYAGQRADGNVPTAAGIDLGSQ
jgi:hypothetical protein